MNTYKRIGNRWTVNELLSLQREYELLGLTIQEIADKHERTVKSILYRLESEGFIDSWKDARGFDMESYEANGNSDDSNNEDADDDTNDDDTNDDDTNHTDEFLKLSSRVHCLHFDLKEIKGMVQQLIDNSSSSTQKNKLVEKYQL